MWPIEVKEKVYKREDGIVRMAYVHTTQGIYKRSARKLHSLNISIDKRRVNQIICSLTNDIMIADREQYIIERNILFNSIFVIHFWKFGQE